MSLLEELTVRISAEPDATFNQTLKAAEDQVEQMTGKITKLASQGSVTFGIISAGASLMIGKWLEAANALQVYQAKLETVLKSSEAATATMQRAISFAAKTPFDVQGIVNATTQIEIYGQKSEKWLPLVGDLAAGMGKSIEETSLVIGKALSGSYDGFQSLRDQFGVTNEKLKKYGATMSSVGGLSLKSAEDIEKARQALEKIIQTDFAGAMERQAKTFQGSLSNYKDSIVNIAAALGQQLAPAFAAMLRVMTTVNNLFLQLPGPIKAVVAWGAVLGAGVTGLAGVLLGLLTLLPKLYGGWTILSNIMGWNTKITTDNSAATIINAVATEKAARAKVGFALATRGASVALKGNAVALLADGTALGTMALASSQAATGISAIGTAVAGISLAALAPVALAIAAVFGRLYVETKRMEAENKRRQEIINKDEEQLNSWRQTTRQYLIQSADDLVASGVTAKKAWDDVAKANEILEERLKEAREAMLKGEKEMANNITETTKKMQARIEIMKDMAIAIAEVEIRARTLENAIRDFETKMSLMGKAGMFKNSIQEVDEYRRHIEFIKPLLEETFQRKFYGDDRDFSYLITNITILKGKIKELKDGLNQGGAADPGKVIELASLEHKLQQLQGLFNVETNIYETHQKEMDDAWKKQVDDDKKREDNELKRYDTVIQRRKDLNDLTLAQEKQYLNQKLSLAEKASKDEEYLADIRHQIQVVEYNQKKQAKEDNAQVIKDELDAVKLMSSGQIAEYSRIIAKIKELIKARALIKDRTKDEGKDLLNTALTGLKSATEKQQREDEKKQKEQYQRMVKEQGKYLQDINRDSQMSVRQRMQYLDSLTRFWEDMERKKVVTHAQAEEQLLKISQKRTDDEQKIIEANKDMEKTLRGYRKESLDYEIDKLNEKLNKGEDVETQLIDKIRKRHEIDLQNIEEQKKEWEREGVTREKIEEGVAQLKQRLHREELDAIDETIQKLKDKNEEEKTQNQQFFNGPMTVQEAFGNAGGFLGAAGSVSRINQRNEAIAALEAEKARRQLEVEQAKANIEKMQAQGYDENTAQGALIGAQVKQQTALINAGGAQKPEEVMANSTNIFAKAVELFAQTINQGAPVTPEEAEAVRGSAASSAAGAKAGSKTGAKGDGINITIKLDGGKAGQQGVTAQKDSNGNLKVSISKDVLAAARGEVSPVGQTRFQSFLNNGSIIGGVGEAFA